MSGAVAPLLLSAEKPKQLIPYAAPPERFLSLLRPSLKLCSSFPQLSSPPGPLRLVLPLSLASLAQLRDPPSCPVECFPTPGRRWSRSPAWRWEPLSFPTEPSLIPRRRWTRSSARRRELTAFSAEPSPTSGRRWPSLSASRRRLRRARYDVGSGQRTAVGEALCVFRRLITRLVLTSIRCCSPINPQSSGPMQY